MTQHTYLWENNQHIEVKFQQRLTRLAKACEVNHCDGVVFNAGLSIHYYFGLSFHLSERPIAALISAAGKIVWVLPQFEVIQLGRWNQCSESFCYDEDPQTWQAAFIEGWKALGISDGSVMGLEVEQMRMLEYRYLQKAAPKAKFVEADRWIAMQRACKDEGELDLHRRAVQIAEQGFLATIPLLRLGMTEKELAGELVSQLYRHGADAMLPFHPIVSFGENTANPHAAPSDRKLTADDLILIDWGASFQGYAADLTRVLIAGKPAAKWEKIAAIVRQANEAARAKAAVGVPAQQVDEAARSLIAQYGYREYFRHRVGHGLGLAVHEIPYLRSDNEEPLQAGMVFTIEPGIYFPGEGGIRIEDDCAVTSQGLITLSSLSRELLSVL